MSGGLCLLLFLFGGHSSKPKLHKHTFTQRAQHKLSISFSSSQGSLHFARPQIFDDAAGANSFKLFSPSLPPPTVRRMTNFLLLFFSKGAFFFAAAFLPRPPRFQSGLYRRSAPIPDRTPVTPAAPSRPLPVARIHRSRNAPKVFEILTFPRDEQPDDVFVAAGHLFTRNLLTTDLTGVGWLVHRSQC